MTINIYIERDLAAGGHKSSRFRCKLGIGEERVFMSTRNRGSVTAAKRDAEDLFGEDLMWRDVDDPVVRAETELTL